VSVPILSIGAVAGGASTSRAWEAAIKRVAQRVIELRESRSSPLAVNVVYQIPGEVLTPEFEGVRTGRFSRRERLLLVQVALPPEPRDADAEVRQLLSEAIEVAEDFARKKAMIEGSLSELRAIVSAI
jgi:hypothetical protein